MAPVASEGTEAMAIIKLFRTLDAQRALSFADADVLERRGYPEGARALRAQAQREWAEIQSAVSGEWICASDLSADTGWSQRSVTDLAKAVRQIDLGLDTRVRKRHGQWWFSVDTALKVPQKGEGPFPTAESLRLADS